MGVAGGNEEPAGQGLRDYRLFARDSVFATLQGLDEHAQGEILALFDSLKADPFQGSDYQDEVLYAGPNTVKLVGAFAVVFYVDHAVREVKILDILSPDDIE